MNQEKILIVDDEHSVRELLRKLLESKGYVCILASSAAEALEYLEKQAIDLVLLDIVMPGESGLDLTRQVAQQYPDTAIVMVTAIDDLIELKIALKAGVYGYVVKPFAPSQILISVVNALRRRELEIARRIYLKDLEKMVAERTTNLEETNLKLQQEITKHKLSKKIITESEQKYRLLISHIPGFVYKGYKDWSVDFSNNKVGELTGYDKEEFDACKLKWSDLINKEDFEEIKKSTKQAISAKDGYIREYKIKTKSGETLWIEDRGRIIRNQKGEIDYFSGVFFDITKQKQAQEQLLKRERYYRSILSNIHESIVIIDKDYRITDVNNTFLNTFDRLREDVIGHTCYEISHSYNKPCNRYGEDCKLREVFETGEPRECIHQHLDTAGSKLWMHILHSPMKDEQDKVISVIETSRDITKQKEADEERQQIEAQLLQSEKMASIGQLAAGVAHEINNPTGFVSSNLKTLSDYIIDISDLSKEYRKLIGKLKQNSDANGNLSDVSGQVKRIAALEKEVDIDFILKDIQELIKESRDGTERIRVIIQDLKDFAHPGEEKPKFADINKNLDSTVNVVWNELKYKAEVSKDYGNLPQVQCYPQLLNQVFVNLLVNAAQSIEDRGEIRIQTRADNGYVEIKISDTGSGIPKENLARIFDPFFTTKEVGKGTGLGLNVAYNIIKKHHGEIDVKSDVGKGTTFTIQIPTDKLSTEGE